MNSLNPKSSKPVFLYDNIIQRIENSSSENSHFYILGGRKMGKTSILSKLKDKYKLPAIYSGKDFNSILSFKESLASLVDDAKFQYSDNKFILIDDLDYMSIGLNVTDHADNSSNLFMSLYEATKMASLYGIKIIASGRHHPAALLKILDEKKDDENINTRIEHEFWSDVLSRWVEIPISPWISLRWSEVLLMKLKTIINKCAANVNNQLESELNDVIHKIIKLTGGYPPLWGVATSELQRIVSDELSMKRTNESGNKHNGISGDIIRLFIHQHILSTAMPVVRSILSSLSMAELSVLKEISLGNVADASKQRTIDLLISAGLTFYDGQEGVYRVPGDILCDELKTYTALSSIFTIEADPENKTKKGFLIIAKGTENIRVSMKGSAWRVLKHLVEARGKIVSVDELLKASKIEKPNTLRSAIRRIESLVSKSTEIQCIENIHGEGYRFSRK